MTWVVHNLGSLDLTFTGPSDSYFVEDIGDPPEQAVDEEYRSLMDGAGVQLVRSAFGDAPLTLNIICLGSTKALAKAARQALRNEVDAVYNGTAKIWEYQEDSSESGPDSWYIKGGVVHDRLRPSSGEQIFALSGLAIACARVILHLSKS